MAEALTLRDARSEDAPALAELISQLGYPSSAQAVLGRLEHLLGDEAARVVVAEEAAEVVGLASLQVAQTLEHDAPAARVTALVVREDRRQRGIGEALVAELESEARRRGCGHIFLTTAERRSGAQAFYRRLGFEETGRRFAKPL